MCNYELTKHFICNKSVFEINKETGNKIPFCVYYKDGKCCKK